MTDNTKLEGPLSIPLPEAQLAVRDLAMELMRQVMAGEIMSLVIAGESTEAEGGYFFLNTQFENVYGMAGWLHARANGLTFEQEFLIDEIGEDEEDGK